MRKILITTLLLSSNLKADNNISYSYLDFGLTSTVFNDTMGLPYDISVPGRYIKGSFDLSKTFYIGGYYKHKGNTSLSDTNNYGLFLGLHKNLTTQTDFYAELDAARIDTNYGFDSNVYGLSAGSRTAFTENFELISRLGYKYIHASSQGDVEVALTGLFKFNPSHAVFLELEAYDDLDVVERKLGYRFSF
ncbi:MAG: hypothetical protein KDI92_14295 [Xanthomonadales bacterium]|nr:hypothetical protein [Xanthomonadales bacterium]